MRKLAPELASWLQEYNQLWDEQVHNGFSYTPQNAREGLARLTQKLVTRLTPVAAIVDSVVTTSSHNIPIRIYRPTLDVALPVLLFLHGGGHVSGSIEVYDPICRQLAEATQHILVALDYRLAPEFPYPCGLEDAEQVIGQIDSLLQSLSIAHRKQLSIAGDSGGGAMCASLAHRLQQNADLQIHKQVLIYPSLDYSLQHASVDLNGRGYLLHKDKIEWFFAQYLRHAEDVKAVSPLTMEFSGRLPATLMITAEFCPLRDEGFEYVEKLKRAGVMNRHIHFDDMIHAFCNMQDLVPEQCDRVYREIARFLNED